MKKSTTMRPFLFSLLCLLLLPAGLAAGPDSDDVLVLRRIDQDLALGTASGVCLTDETLVLDDHEGILSPYGEFLSHEIELPVASNAFIATWMGRQAKEGQVRVWVRGIDERGRRSRWHRIERESDVLLDAVATRVQYRILLLADGKDSPIFQGLSLLCETLRDDAPPAEPTADDPVPPTTAPAPAPVDPVEAPAITERADWGALAPDGAYSSHAPVYLVVHHTAIPDLSQYAGAATIRGIQRAHFARGWMDIGYHFLVGPEGTIYRGRPDTVVGAHCPPNTGKVGISVIGNFMEEEVPAAAETALRRLLAWLAKRHGLAASRIKAHRDFSTSLCPGDDLYDRLPAMRAAIAAMLAAERR